MTAATHPSGLKVQTAELANARPPKWARLHWLRVGYLSLILGAEGIGKSTLVAWLIARLTHGDLPGDPSHTQGPWATRTRSSHVWVPRLHAAGVELSRVKALEGEHGIIELEQDREKLATAIDLEQIEFVFFDALIDNLGAAVNDWHPRDVRAALQPLRQIARELDVTVTGSMHPNKKGSTFRDLVAGSSAFNAVSRSSLLRAQHPEDEGLRCLVRGKGNLSAAPRAVEFTIEGHRFEANGHTFSVPRAARFDVGDITLEELVDLSGARTPKPWRSSRPCCRRTALGTRRRTSMARARPKTSRGAPPNGQ